VTGTSWEHQREARDALRTIVADPQLGVAALSSTQTMSNLLKDLLPDAPKETSVLVAAAEAGLAQTLLDHVGQGMDVATASSLAASAFAARTPFTTDACNWAVGELAVALGLARGEPAPGPASATPAYPGEAQAGPMTGAPAAPGWAPPGYGYPGANPATGAVPGALGMAPPGARPPAGPPGAGYRYPPPPVPGTAAGYGYPGQGAAAPGYPYPQRTVPGTVPGQGPRPRRTPKAWMILTGCVAIVALIGGIAALARHDNSSNATTIEPLSQLVKPDVTTCKSTVTLGLRRLTHREFCQTSVHNIGLDAYQFATASAYADGLSRLNTITGWSPSGAGTKCPPRSGDADGQTLWHSNVNSRYRQRAGQILECYSLRRPSFLLYLWTLPTQRVILVANDDAAGATFADLEKWWSGLNYG
jgi:hypothetical protein